MSTIHRHVLRLHNSDLGILFIRLALGVVFINSGWAKVTDIESVIGFLGQLGFPAIFAYVVAYVEFLGGIAFVLGVFVRYFGILVAIVMAVAMAKVHWVKGFALADGGYEYVLVLMLMALAVVTTGAGRYTIRRLVKKG